MWNNRNSHMLLIKRQTNTTQLELIFAISKTAKHIRTIMPTHFTLEFLPKGHKGNCPHKDLCMNVYNSVIHNSKKCKQLKYTSAGEIKTSIQWDIFQQ